MNDLLKRGGQEPRTATHELQRGFGRYIVPIVLGLLPGLLLMLTWSPGADPTRLESALCNIGGPVVAAELFAIIVASREGMLRTLPPALVAAVALLVAISVTAATRCLGST